MRLTDGSYDFSDGVDSNKVTTLASELVPNGLRRSQLAWLVNAGVRGGGITQRFGWQPLQTGIGQAWWQGGFIYEPDNATPYLIISIGGQIIRVDLVEPYAVTNLSLLFGLSNPATPRKAYFCQAEQYLIIQAGDFFTNPVPTLPLFWDHTTLRRSLGIAGGELPAATAMDYYMGRLWYAQGRFYGAGDIVQSPVSGTIGARYRDSVLKVTENPLVLGGDGFAVPDNAGNIQALAHTDALDTVLGQSQLFIFTRKAVYTLQVPVTRTDWIATGDGTAGTDNPLQKVILQNYGTTSERSIVKANGDLFFQSMEPGIRSLMLAQRYFQQWGNTQISSNMNRLLEATDRSLLDHGSGIEFSNRMLQTVLPFETALGVAHKGLAVLNYDPLGSFGNKGMPIWEGHHEGLDILQVFQGDFGGRQRAFIINSSRVGGTIDLWEMTDYDRRENGDNRITWITETAAYTFGKEFQLKQLQSAEIWIDKLFGTADFTVEFRPDSDPCWHKWAYFQLCTARDSSEDATNPVEYPLTEYRESWRSMVTLPAPPTHCASNEQRPVHIAYQFQLKITITGWCRIRAILLYATERDHAPWEGMVCAQLIESNLAT